MTVVVCDQGATNQQLFRILGVTVARPVASINSQKIMFMFDVPHLLKNVRNNLMKHDFEINGNVVK